MPYYVAIVEDAGPDQAIGVWFPDLPGCFSAGDNVDEALQNAEEALSLYAEAEAKEGRNLPPPRLLSELRRDPAAADDLRDHMVALVALHPLAAHAAERMSATISISNFGNGNVTPIDGNTLTIQFDRASEKRLWVSDDRGEASFANSSVTSAIADKDNTTRRGPAVCRAEVAAADYNRMSRTSRRNARRARRHRVRCSPWATARG